MKLSQLENNIKNKKSFLCLGLDSDIDKIPKHLLGNSDPVFEFNKILIDELNQKIVAVKLNTAFYESRGAAGWTSMEKTINYLNKFYPELFTIADAKRGDIGNTSKMYANAFLKELNFDSITVSPYMGYDSVEPFLSIEDKLVFLLTLTSNNGSNDFQELDIDDNNKLYQKVIEISKTWKNSSRIMYVVGAKNTKEILKIRRMVPNSYLLIPGVGAQGGNMTEICKYGLDKNLKLIINSTRSIIYASANDDFAQSAAYEAKKIQVEMEKNINALKL